MPQSISNRIEGDRYAMPVMPPGDTLQQKLRKTIKALTQSAPGRRAAALSAAWIAATGCEANIALYDAEEALRTYRVIESELRAELRHVMSRAYNTEPHSATRTNIATMVSYLEDLERQAIATKPPRNRRKRSS